MAPKKPSRSALPLQIHPSRRFLTDQKGDPFLIHGDTAWSIITAIMEADADAYLADRAARGFNAIIVNLIEHKFNGPLTRTGLHPFTDPKDLSTPNPAYFEYAKRIIAKAEKLGIVVFLCAMYLGYKHPLDDDGWFHEARLSGNTGCFRYGQYIGKLFAENKNIIWMMGGDRNADGVVDEVNSLVRGIKSANPVCKIFTAHPHPESVAVEEYGGTTQGGWLDLAVTYTYHIVHEQIARDYRATPTMPFVMVESSYEGEHNSSPAQVRRQAYWAILGGACGQFLGNNPIWLFDPGWKEAMALEGSVSMEHLKTFALSRAWHTLIPDTRVAGPMSTAHTEWLLEGCGELRGLDYAGAACTPDGNTLLVYMPTPREIVVNLPRMNGKRIRGWWFDPRTGKTQTAGEFPAAKPVRLSPPGAGDWALVLDDAALDLPAPGA